MSGAGILPLSVQVLLHTIKLKNQTRGLVLKFGSR